MFERLHLFDMMQYLLRDMLCKMMDIGRLESYVAAMTLPSGIKEDVVLMTVPLLKSMMMMMGVLLMFQLGGDLM